MKHIVPINEGWAFVKGCETAPAAIPAGAARVDLPHCWNALDGQDGGSDYWRGPCCYLKTIEKPAGKNVYVEVEAASSVGKIIVNGVEKASHKGGYSLFRANVTDALHDGENLLAIWVDNTQRDDVYPQTADFTFYGGLYRGVNLITVEDSRFDLDYCGGKGFDVSAAVEDGAAVVSLDAFITNPVEGQSVEFIVRDAAGVIVAGAVRPAAERVHAEVRIENAHLWQGVKDPYLYAVEALLTVHNETIDNVSANLGVRTYTVDPQKGFFLNGVLTPLRGVSRHQDRLGQGNALTKEQHEEDVAFIREVGANTVRLAHYQHSPYFYDACDRAGLVVWAEIPFISVMNPAPGAHENCRSQMKELIVQNYNHPSICFWGISNEITIGGERPGLLDNLRICTISPTCSAITIISAGTAASWKTTSNGWINSTRCIRTARWASPSTARRALSATTATRPSARTTPRNTRWCTTSIWRRSSTSAPGCGPRMCGTCLTLAVTPATRAA